MASGFDTTELRKLAADAARSSPKAHKATWDALRKTTFDGIAKVKREMPVDTGRARASWGLWTSNDLVKPNEQAGSSDAILELRQSALETIQGSNVPYIPALNDGHSRQAPAGFIDRAEDWMNRDLDERLAAMMSEAIL